MNGHIQQESSASTKTIFDSNRDLWSLYQKRSNEESDKRTERDKTIIQVNEQACMPANQQDSRQTKNSVLSLLRVGKLKVIWKCLLEASHNIEQHIIRCIPRRGSLKLQSCGCTSKEGPPNPARQRGNFKFETRREARFLHGLVNIPSYCYPDIKHADENQKRDLYINIFMKQVSHK